MAEEKIIEFECPRLNKLYMEKLADAYERNQPGLLEKGKIDARLSFLQDQKSPGLKAGVFTSDERDAKLFCLFTGGDDKCNDGRNCGFYEFFR